MDPIGPLKTSTVDLTINLVELGMEGGVLDVWIRIRGWVSNVESDWVIGWIWDVPGYFTRGYFLTYEFAGAAIGVFVDIFIGKPATNTRCLKITEKVSFHNIASEASYVYSSDKSSFKNAKK